MRKNRQRKHRQKQTPAYKNLTSCKANEKPYIVEDGDSCVIISDSMKPAGTRVPCPGIRVGTMDTNGETDVYCNYIKNVDMKAGDTVCITTTCPTGYLNVQEQWEKAVSGNNLLPYDTNPDKWMEGYSGNGNALRPFITQGELKYVTDNNENVFKDMKGTTLTYDTVTSAQFPGLPPAVPENTLDPSSPCSPNSSDTLHPDGQTNGMGSSSWAGLCIRSEFGKFSCPSGYTQTKAVKDDNCNSINGKTYDDGVVKFWATNSDCSKIHDQTNPPVSSGTGDPFPFLEVGDKVCVPTS